MTMMRAQLLTTWSGMRIVRDYWEQWESASADTWHSDAL